VTASKLPNWQIVYIMSNISIRYCPWLTLPKQGQHLRWAVRRRVGLITLYFNNCTYVNKFNKCNCFSSSDDFHETSLSGHRSAHEQVSLLQEMIRLQAVWPIFCFFD
jgi:hypothetical protein